MRKAYEGQRTQRTADPYDPNAGVLYGVDSLWPTLLVQCRLFRAALGFVDSGKRHQVYAYALEAVVEDGLKADFGTLYDFIYERYRTLDVELPSVQDKVGSRIELYYGWKKAERRRRLGNLLEVLDPSYSFIYKMRTENGETDLLTPATLSPSIRHRPHRVSIAEPKRNRPGRRPELRQQRGAATAAHQIDHLPLKSGAYLTLLSAISNTYSI